MERHGKVAEHTARLIHLRMSNRKTVTSASSLQFNMSQGGWYFLVLRTARCLRHHQKTYRKIVLWHFICAYRRQVWSQRTQWCSGSYIWVYCVIKAKLHRDTKQKAEIHIHKSLMLLLAFIYVQSLSHQRCFDISSVKLQDVLKWFRIRQNKLENKLKQADQGSHGLWKLGCIKEF